MKEIILKGTPLSEGIAIGRPHFLLEKIHIFKEIALKGENIEEEILRYRDALKKSREDLKELLIKFEKEDPSVAEIIEAHIAILDDPFLTDHMEEKIRSLKKAPEWVFYQEIEQYKSSFEKRALFERIQDIADITKRILKNLGKPSFETPESPHVLCGLELTPTHIAEAPSVLGFISQKGGITSHAAIIARAKKIPYIAKISIEELSSYPISQLLLDGFEGKVILNPSSETIQAYHSLHKKKAPKITIKELPFMKISANIETIDDIPEVLTQKAYGVGLFRSEYLFFSGKEVTEESQFVLYKKMAEQLKDLPLVVRLFDLGGDKAFSRAEPNPALGCRGIRYLLKNRPLLLSQLRALIRASLYGNVCILIPFVSDLYEVKEVKNLLLLLQKELKIEKKIPLGCMIEIPSVALISGEIAKEVDFLSIGTNDLSQYLLAYDRSYGNLAYLDSWMHPSLAKLLKMILSSSDKPISLCGEIAGDLLLTEQLVKLGIKEFSVSPSRIGALRQKLFSLLP